MTVSPCRHISAMRDKRMSTSTMTVYDGSPSTFPALQRRSYHGRWTDTNESYFNQFQKLNPVQNVSPVCEPVVVEQLAQEESAFNNADGETYRFLGKKKIMEIFWLVVYLVLAVSFGLYWYHYDQTDRVDDFVDFVDIGLFEKDDLNAMVPFLLWWVDVVMGLGVLINLNDGWCQFRIVMGWAPNEAADPVLPPPAVVVEQPAVNVDNEAVPPEPAQNPNNVNEAFNAICTPKVCMVFYSVVAFIFWVNFRYAMDIVVADVVTFLYKLCLEMLIYFAPMEDGLDITIDDIMAIPDIQDVVGGIHNQLESIVRIVVWNTRLFMGAVLVISLCAAFYYFWDVMGSNGNQDDDPAPDVGFGPPQDVPVNEVAQPEPNNVQAAVPPVANPANVQQPTMVEKIAIWIVLRSIILFAGGSVFMFVGICLTHLYRISWLASHCFKMYVWRTIVGIFVTTSVQSLPAECQCSVFHFVTYTFPVGVTGLILSLVIKLILFMTLGKVISKLYPIIQRRLPWHRRAFFTKTQDPARVERLRSHYDQNKNLIEQTECPVCWEVCQHSRILFPCLHHTCVDCGKLPDFGKCDSQCPVCRTVIDDYVDVEGKPFSAPFRVGRQMKEWVINWGSGDSGAVGN